MARKFTPGPGRSLDTRPSAFPVKANRLVPTRSERRDAVIAAGPKPIKPLDPSKVIKGGRA